MIYTIKFTWGSSDFFFGPASPPLKSRPSLLQTNNSEVLEAMLNCWWCYLLEICVEGGDEAVLRVFAKLTLSPSIQYNQCISVFLRHQNPILDFTFTFSAWLSVFLPLLDEIFQAAFETPSQILYWQSVFRFGQNMKLKLDGKIDLKQEVSSTVVDTSIQQNNGLNSHMWIKMIKN